MRESTQPKERRTAAKVSESQGNHYRLACGCVSCPDLLEGFFHASVSLAEGAGAGQTGSAGE